VPPEPFLGESEATAAPKALFDDKISNFMRKQKYRKRRVFSLFMKEICLDFIKEITIDVPLIKMVIYLEHFLGDSTSVFTQ
jgi:hypothetical protein